MTTREPGARLVFTHGLELRPSSTAFFASRPAPIITCGFEVFVQLVIAAITTWPWSRVNSRAVREAYLGRAGTAAPSRAGVGRGPPGSERASASANIAFDRRSGTRSWGRDGPAMLGSIVDRSSSSRSE